VKYNIPSIKTSTTSRRESKVWSCYFRVSVDSI
jgi:hypothetical protein